MTLTTTRAAIHLYEVAQNVVRNGAKPPLTVEEAAAIRQLLEIVPTLNMIVNVMPDVFVESIT